MNKDETTAAVDPKRIAITGAGGLIGSALWASFADEGHTLQRVTRTKSGRPTDIYWQPRGRQIDAAALEGVDVVIHLAGESLFGRWTAQKKESILKSRSEGTDLLARSLAELRSPPQVFVSTSAVGFYGNTGDRVVDETAAPGDTFLAEVCKRWEAASRPAREAGIRTVNTRLGVVLSKEGGALKLMALPFKLGVGGRVGAGEQFMSWIALDDVVRALRFVIANPEFDGAVNVTSPNPVSNQEFTKTLGRVVRRPTVFPLPAALVRLGAGQMGEEMLLHGQRAVPKRLQDAGFDFAYAGLEAALRHELDG